MKNANKVSRSFQHMILLCGCLLIYYSVSARQHKPTESGYIAQKTQGIDSDYVLIFNSYSESAPWCRSLVDSTVMDLIKLSPQTMTVTQNLNSGLLRDEKALAQLRQQVDVSYHDKPRMIIYIGSTSWPFLHETIEKKWGESTFYHLLRHRLYRSYSQSTPENTDRTCPPHPVRQDCQGVRRCA